MLKQKATIARQWILRLICGIAMGLLVILFRGDLTLRAGLGQSQEGPQVEITEVEHSKATTRRLLPMPTASS